MVVQQGRKMILLNYNKCVKFKYLQNNMFISCSCQCRIIKEILCDTKIK